MARHGCFAYPTLLAIVEVAKSPPKNSENGMAHLTIVGLGPGRWEQLTLAAYEAIQQHDEIWLRNRQHPLTAQLATQLAVQSFDMIGADAVESRATAQEITAQLVALAMRPQGVLYGVPGHPFVDERGMAQIIQAAEQHDVPLTVIDGVSIVGPTLMAGGCDAPNGWQIVAAEAFVQRYVPPFDADRPVRIVGLVSRALATEVQRNLLQIYPANHPVVLWECGECEAQSHTVESLHEVVGGDTFSHQTALWIPARPRPGALPHLHDIVAHLRAPEGCPWDQEQDHASLRDALLEEAYEAADAIDRADWANLAEEVGDLLLSIVMHSQIAHEAGRFSLHEVVASVSEKLIRRHPHVFGTVDATDSATVLQNWEAIKAEERAAKGATAPEDEYAAVALALPALTRAQKVSKVAMRNGWRPASTVDFSDATALGALLLDIAAHAKAADLNAEAALGAATARLITAQRQRKGQG